MGIPLDKASFLALFLETLFYGALPTIGIVELEVMMSSHTFNRRVLYFILVDAIRLVQENWHSTTTSCPCSNLAALYCNSCECINKTSRENCSTKSPSASRHRFCSSARSLRIQGGYDWCKCLLFKPCFAIGSRIKGTLHYANHSCWWCSCKFLHLNVWSPSE